VIQVKAVLLSLISFVEAELFPGILQASVNNVFARLNLFKKLGIRRTSEEIYVLHRKPVNGMTENTRTFLAKKSANRGFLTQVLTAVE
jgi:hypothetical protein